MRYNNINMVSLFYLPAMASFTPAYIRLLLKLSVIFVAPVRPGMASGNPLEEAPGSRSFS
jgi:hypothetical protein